jgi:hypothetical protein
MKWINFVLVAVPLLLFMSCTLAENPRESVARGAYEERLASKEVLETRGDLVIGWDDQRSHDLHSGTKWAQTVNGRTLGGSLVRMLSVDEKLPVEYPVISQRLTVSAPTISADNLFFCYQTIPADPTQNRGNELWIGHLTQKQARGRSFPKPSEILPFQLEREADYQFFRWSPTGHLFAYYRSGSRQLLVGEVYIDLAKQVKIRILQQVSPKGEYNNCTQIEWQTDGSQVISLWKIPDGGVSVWTTKPDGAGQFQERRVPYSREVLEKERPVLIRLIPYPLAGAERKGLVLVEARKSSSTDEDQRRVDIWDIGKDELATLPGLSGNYLAPRWCGRGRFIASKVKAGIARSRGTRWQSWGVFVFSAYQAQGHSDNRPLRLPYDFAALDWNQNSYDMDQQLVWLVDGEVCVFIDPDTQRNIRLSDHRGENRLDLLKNRDRQTPQILWLQGVSVAEQDGERNYLYFLEDVRGANLKRIDITPLSRK